MNNNFIHLIQVPFTGVGIRPFRGQEWYKYRIELFKNYTLKSLLNQTNRKFVLWLTFRPEERDNPLTQELAGYLKEKGVLALMTFTGLPYWDDKFNKGLKEKFMNLARIVRMAYQDSNSSPVNTPWAFLKMLLTNKFPVNFGWKQALRGLLEDKNGTLKDRLTMALGHLKANLPSEAVNWVYVSRIDSDDMFHEDFVQEVQSIQPFPGALTCRNGYVYDSNTGKLAEWEPKTNPPFHTIIFPKDNFFQADRYLQYFRSFKSHEDIPNVFNSQNLKDGQYCVVIHNNHISTQWNHPWKGGEIKDKQEIIDSFGIGNKRERLFLMDGHKFAKADNEPNQALREIVGDYLAHVQQNRIWEPETTKVVKELVKEGDVCVDVGASIGYFTLLFAELVGKSGKVLAFEPTDNQCEYIKKNLKLNGYENAEVHNLAAWDGEESNFVRRDTPMDKNLKEHLAHPQRIQVNAGYGKKIKGIVLDDVLPKKVDFIKMDIDGSEPRALKGLIKTFERNPQLKMVVEYYPKCMEELGNDPKEMMAILDKYFTYERISGDYNDEYYNLICKRRSP